MNKRSQFQRSKAGGEKFTVSRKVQTINFKLWNRRGFTLLELLVAVSILAIGVSLTFALFSEGIDIWENAEFSGSLKQNAILFLEDVEKELKNCVNFSEIKFAGQDDNFVFPAFIRNYKGDADSVAYIIGCVEYSFDEEKSVIYKKRAAYPDCTKEDTFTAIIVLESVKSLNFEYASLNEEQGLEWTDMWKRFPEKPLAVKIKAEVVVSEKTGETYALEKTVYMPLI